jgi:membrane protease YdiL (CAAX protease family)
MDSQRRNGEAVQRLHQDEQQPAFPVSDEPLPSAPPPASLSAFGTPPRSGLFGGRRVPHSTQTDAQRAVVFLLIWVIVGFVIRAIWGHGIGVINAYLLIGIPWTWFFQRAVREKNLSHLWVKDRPPATGANALVSVAAVAAAAIFGILRLRSGWHDAPWTIRLMLIVAVIAAIPFGYALGGLRRGDAKWLVGSAVVSGGLAAAFFFLALSAMKKPIPPAAIRIGLSSFALYLPICFMVEEVSMRGLVDDAFEETYPLANVKSALAQCALWGLWHFPILPSYSLGTPVALVVFHVLLGFPLTIAYRRTGNLFVPALTHALIDALRNALVGMPGG